jgi:hypothetical protein
MRMTTVAGDIRRPIQVASCVPDHVREILTWATGFIPNRNVQEAVFAVLLITTDHIFNLREL